MKMIGGALLSSVFTLFLAMLYFEDRLLPRLKATPGVLELRELHIVDGTGAVRMILSAHARGSEKESPALELLPSGTERGGAVLLLDETGKGSLIFHSSDTYGKVMVGHFVTGDVRPPSTSDHSWGLKVLNLRPVQGVPDSLYFGATEGGNVEVSGVTIKQGPPPDIHPVHVH